MAQDDRERDGQKRAFISSTSIDLPDHRKQVTEACLRMGYYPVGMEHWPAEDADAETVCLREVERANLFRHLRLPLRLGSAGPRPRARAAALRPGHPRAYAQRGHRPLNGEPLTQSPKSHPRGPMDARACPRPPPLSARVGADSSATLLASPGSHAFRVSVA
jgi:hypothetical protein